MPALDTNVLVRYLVRDDAVQHRTAREIVSAATAEGLFVTLTVLLELEWVLRSRYGIGRRSMIDAIAGLLEMHELDIQDEASVERALALYDNGTADFADCLHAGIATTHDRAPLMTFDKKASRMAGAMLATRRRSR